MKTPNNEKQISRLIEQREMLREQLTAMNSVITNVYEQNLNARNAALINAKLNNQIKQIQQLKQEYQDYCQVLEGKYGIQICEEIEKVKSEKSAIKKQILQIQRTISNEVNQFEISEENLKAEFKLKVELEELKHKNQKKAEEIQKCLGKITDIRKKIGQLSFKEGAISRQYSEYIIDKQYLDPQNKSKLELLKSKIKKLQQDSDRRSALKLVEYNTKINKLEELESMQGEFEFLQNELNSKIEESQLTLKELMKQRPRRRQQNFTSNQTNNLKNIRNKLNKLQTQSNALPEKQIYINRHNSVLEDEYPEQYRNLFLESIYQKPLNKSSLNPLRKRTISFTK